MKKRGQIAVEYVMIVALGMLILLPAIFFFRQYAFESNDQIIESRLADIAGQIMVKARTMYYYGPPSQTTVTLDMPPQINSMFVINEPDDYHIGFQVLTSQGEKEFIFQSDIPLGPGDSELCGPKDISYCDTYDCLCFSNRSYSGGIKNFRIRAAQCDYDGNVNCINITEISRELS